MIGSVLKITCSETLLYCMKLVALKQRKGVQPRQFEGRMRLRRIRNTTTIKTIQLSRSAGADDLK